MNAVRSGERLRLRSGGLAPYETAFQTYEDDETNARKGDYDTLVVSRSIKRVDEINAPCPPLILEGE